MQITAILPVSRVGYLDRVLDSLAEQTVKPNSLIVIFDGNDEDFEKTKDIVLKRPWPLAITHILCYRSTNSRPAFAIAERRQHIASIHNQLRELIGDPDWVFSVEDDGILPPDALEKLVRHTAELNGVGMITGVELGRWGVPYVGAWCVDNVHEPKKVQSMENKAPENIVEPIDGCGLYCALIRGTLYKQHVFGSYNGLGPDVNLGIFCRQQGYSNAIDWSINVTHLTNRNGIEMEIPATDLSQIVTLTLLGQNTWQQVKYPFGITLKEKYGQVMF